MTAAELTLKVRGTKTRGERVGIGLICAFAAFLLAAVFVRTPLPAAGAEVRAGVETIAGMAVLAAAVAALLRAQRTRAPSDLALALAIWLTSLTSLLVAALALEPSISTSAVEWLAVPMRLGGGVLLLAAGRPALPARRRMPGLSGLALLAVAVTATLSLTGVLLGLLIDAAVPVAIQLVTAGLYLAGAFSIWRRAQRLDSGALRWFAVGATSLAGMRLAFALFGASAGHWLSPGEATRLVAGALLLMAARAEVLVRARHAMESRIAQERHRLAREIHDGMAQELAFIVSQSRRLVGGGQDARTLEMLAQAGQNALVDARRTIYNLKRTPTKALSATIVERAWQMTARAGLALDVEIEGEIPVGAEAQHAILRVVEEAISNVAKHGRAGLVSIGVRTAQERVVVRIADNGRGFDPDETRRRGFGLTSMTQRVESLGGRLRLESAPGQGTMVEATI